MSDRASFRMSPQTAIQRWEDGIAQKVAAGMTHLQAVQALNKENPALHEEYLIAKNGPRSRQRIEGTYTD